VVTRKRKPLLRDAVSACRVHGVAGNDAVSKSNVVLIRSRQVGTEEKQPRA
jgi:hypothetical protein